MPDLGDFHAFNSTSGGSGGVGSGCSGSFWGWVIAILVILYLIGKFG